MAAGARCPARRIAGEPVNPTGDAAWTTPTATLRLVSWNARRPRRPGAAAGPSGHSCTQPRTRASTPRSPTARLAWSGLASAAEPAGEQLLSLLGALTAVRLCLAEQLGQLGVAVTLGILDVGLQAQRVAQAGLGVPDEVVVLVRSAGHIPGLTAATGHAVLLGLTKRRHRSRPGWSTPTQILQRRPGAAATPGQFPRGQRRQRGASLLVRGERAGSDPAPRSRSDLTPTRRQAGYTQDHDVPAVPAETTDRLGYATVREHTHGPCNGNDRPLPAHPGYRPAPQPGTGAGAAGTSRGRLVH